MFSLILNKLVKFLVLDDNVLFIKNFMNRIDFSLSSIDDEKELKKNMMKTTIDISYKSIYNHVNILFQKFIFIGTLHYITYNNYPLLKIYFQTKEYDIGYFLSYIMGYFYFKKKELCLQKENIAYRLRIKTMPILVRKRTEKNEFFELSSLIYVLVCLAKINDFGINNAIIHGSYIYFGCYHGDSVLRNLYTICWANNYSKNLN